MEEDGKKPNLTGLKPRAFINDVDTHFGTVLARTLSKKGDYEIRGTLREADREDQQQSPPKWVQGTVPKGQVDILSKALLSSDLIVYQLIDTVEDATVALKVLMNAHYETEKTFILISSVQTWAESRQRQRPPPPAAGADTSGEAAEEEEFEQDEFTEDMYNKRVPHVKYTAWKEVEKLCKQANSATLHTYCIFSGLQYGEGEDFLHPIFKQAWHLAPEGLPVFTDRGRNVVPMIHVQDLATFALKLAAKDPEEQRYYFGVDEGNSSWAQIIGAINQHLGNGKTYRVPEQDYILYEHIEHFIVNLKIEAAGIKSIVDEEEWIAKSGFIENAEKVVKEFKVARKVTPLRIALLGPPGAGKSHYGRLLAQHYKLNHITIQDVIREFEAQQTQLQEEIDRIRQRKREEARKAKLEEKARLKAEQAAIKAAQHGDNDEDEEEPVEEVEKTGEEEEEEDEEKGEGEEGEKDVDDEGDEEMEKVKARLSEVQIILNMRVKPKAPKVDEDDKDKKKGGKAKPALKGKLKKDPSPPETPADEVKVPPRYTDKCLAIMCRWKLAQPGCRNQGFVLDGYPKTVPQAKLLFEEGELELPAEGEEADEEPEEEKGPDAEETELVKADDKLLPDFAIHLTASDAFLTERLMQIVGQHPHNNPADFQRRLDFYKANTKPTLGVPAYLESVLSNADEIREVSVREIAADSAPLLPPPPPSPLDDPPIDAAFQQMVEFIGEPHNYGPTPQEIDAAKQRKLRKEQELQRAQEHLLQEQLAKEQADKELLERLRKDEARRLAEIREQERQMLEIRKEPLKRYLMENVIPVLTKGLIEVCEVRPADPIDYLAEWLFRHNPHPDENAA